VSSFLRPDIIGVMIPIVAILCGTFIAALKIMRGGGSSRGESSEEDVRLIQDIHNGLQQMEKRIEALETIMLDRERARTRDE
jgi:phage shock protein B